ncbi:aldehyde dehydrogenase iron-sulfur subunit [Marinobacter nanhaiticus D15-8W]|uniref:(2Fe-2S)-binding protein n=1 Tax=Marinobacter nanhaiticus D15-8W TaxID=626887 RepID=N6WVA6_9GAMM|nr:2Fe-2S iron-sulfur cluster-binding protein [Marinobacter nanhaiticus]ENO12748.1 (2Fe-2S)-binding protein [Marinobacter nanhaiticus D15-8W]BES70095.1 aldehyde dehydrogenase iron-sulfur subunit [Marinobacter nanhaiticus D15-8W]
MAVLSINGQEVSLNEDPRTTLLDTLREIPGLTGTKKGCDHGQCGACTLLLDGRRVNSCLILAVQCEGSEVTTIEGLAQDGTLNPLQEAFVRHDGFQCGYCTPGQICSAQGMLDELANLEPSDVTGKGEVSLSREEIQERMSGNLCRCGAYANIVDAILEAAEKTGVASSVSKEAEA